MHKWHSNTPSLQSFNKKSESELTYAHGKFKNRADLTKISGVPWNKIRDNLSIVVVPEVNENLITKRKLYYI